MSSDDGKSGRRRSDRPGQSDEADLEPDAWQRFQRTVGKVVTPKRPPPKTDEKQEK